MCVGVVAEGAVNALHFVGVKEGLGGDVGNHVNLDHTVLLGVSINPGQRVRVVVAEVRMVVVFVHIARIVVFVLDFVKPTMPVKLVYTGIILDENGISGVGIVRVELRSIGSVEFERFGHGSAAAFLESVFQGDVLVEDVTVIVAHGVPQRCAVAAQHGREGLPVAGRGAVVAESVFRVLRHEGGVEGEVSVEHRVDFHDVAVLEVAGGGVNLYIVELGEVNHLHDLSGAGQTVAASIHQVEIPVAAGQRVNGVVVFVVILGEVRPVVLALIEDHIAQGGVGGVVHDRYAVREDAVLDLELHASGVRTAERGPFAEVVQVVSRGVHGGGRRLHVCGGDFDGRACVLFDIAMAVETLSFHADDVVAVVDGQRVPAVSGDLACRIDQVEAGIVFCRVSWCPVVGPDLGQARGRCGYDIIAGIHQRVGHLAVVVACGRDHLEFHSERAILCCCHVQHDHQGSEKHKNLLHISGFIFKFFE